MRTLLMILVASVTALAQESVPTGPVQGPPPKNLTKLADGHISANTEPATTEDFEVHVVVAGDTLSKISSDSLNDMKLWPQLWEQNAHIVNPHWIYPNDKILIKKVTPIAAAQPPAPEPEPVVEQPAPEPPKPVIRASRVKLVAAPAPYVIPPAASVIDISPPRNYPQIKAADIACAGFVRSVPVASDLKVSGVADSDKALFAGDLNYVYLNAGTQSGVQTGGSYQIIRPTRKIDSPSLASKDRDLGTHYLQIAKLEIMTGQNGAAMARITESCEAVEVGDLVVPYMRAPFPDLPTRRPFSASMKGSGEAQGHVAMTMNVLVNSSSAFHNPSRLAGVGQGSLAGLERGIAGEGNVVYIDVARAQNIKPGDIFIVFRDTEEPTPDGKKVMHRTAIGEVVVVNVEDRASTALVTYSTDAIALGDLVERR